MILDTPPGLSASIFAWRLKPVDLKGRVSLTSGVFPMADKMPSYITSAMIDVLESKILALS
jgi:hypothetical protein